MYLREPRKLDKNFLGSHYIYRDAKSLIEMMTDY